jgi:hypothetical protein
MICLAESSLIGSSLHKVDLRTVGSRVGWRLQSVKRNASVLQAAGVLKHAA